MAKKKDKAASGGKPPETKKTETPKADTALMAAIEPEEDPRDIDPEEKQDEVHPLVTRALEMRERFVALRTNVTKMSREDAFAALSDLAQFTASLCATAQETVAETEQRHEALIQRIENLENDRDELTKELETAKGAAAAAPEADAEKADDDEPEELDAVVKRDIIALAVWGAAAGADPLKLVGELDHADVEDVVRKAIDREMAMRPVSKAPEEERSAALGFAPAKVAAVAVEPGITAFIITPPAVLEVREPRTGVVETMPAKAPVTPPVPRGWVVARSEGPCVACKKPTRSVNTAARWMHVECTAAEERSTYRNVEGHPALPALMTADDGPKAPEAAQDGEKKGKGKKPKAAAPAAPAPPQAPSAPTPAPAASREQAMADF